MFNWFMFSLSMIVLKISCLITPANRVLIVCVLQWRATGKVGSRGVCVLRPVERAPDASGGDSVNLITAATSQLVSVILKNINRILGSSPFSCWIHSLMSWTLLEKVTEVHCGACSPVAEQCVGVLQSYHRPSEGGGHVLWETTCRLWLGTGWRWKDPDPALCQRPPLPPRGLTSSPPETENKDWRDDGCLKWSWMYIAH